MDDGCSHWDHCTCHTDLFSQVLDTSGHLILRVDELRGLGHALSGLGTMAEQFHEGVKKAFQPALVGHALLHHLLLTRVLSCLLDVIRLFRRTRKLG